MIVFFIEESGKNNFFKKCEIIDDRIILNCNINKKIIQKIVKYLHINNCNNVILSKNLKLENDLTNTLYANNINIINGRKLHKQLLEEIIDKICIKNAVNPIDSQISVMVNYLDTEISNLIERLSKKFKSLNIVSKNIDNFKNLENKICDEYGILITITNNKKKSLKKSDIVLNIDFTEELINKYLINDKAILINFCEINKIKFSGKIINNYNISLKLDTNIFKTLQQKRYKKFDLKDLAEIYIIKYPEEIKNIIID